ncbi:MAG: chemotaxis protein CheB [Bacteroidetes bacterium]|nr:MAG: chemotaxis protein CheB [Bacteroidota bacterium]
MVRAVVIGGSAGSFPVVTSILHALPEDYGLPVLLALHRLKHVRAGFMEALQSKSNLEVLEPYDKDRVLPGKVYLAPSNYHMYVESNHRFQLTTEEPVNHSRPSIDILFSSVARVYGAEGVGVILSGANRDGAQGLARLKAAGGVAVVQDPAASLMPTMPSAAQGLCTPDWVLSPEGIVEYLLTLA